MAEPTKSEKKLSPNTSAEVYSLNSSFSVIDSDEAPKASVVPFTFLKGERDLFKGDSVDGFAVLTNYRFYHKGFAGEHLINVPLGLIGRIQTSGKVLFIFCKNGRSYSLAFPLSDLEGWVEQIQSKLNHTESESCFAFTHFEDSVKDSICVIESADATMNNSTSEGKTAQPILENVDSKDATCKNGDDCGSRNSKQNYEDLPIVKEAKRMEFNLEDVWSINAINEKYQLCETYPRFMIIPKSVKDADLVEVSKYRRKNRIPAVVWRHKGNGRVIARSGQPAQGWRYNISSEDQELLAAIHEACMKDGEKEVASKFLIVDARSRLAALGNRFHEGGHEDVQYYANCEIQFMDIANIHEVRKSLDAISLLCSTPDRVQWLSYLEQTWWMFHISSIIKAALVIVEAIHDHCRPVLVHCSDGWDRTAQLTSLAQLLLDPYYRTMEGFQILVEREWLEFGHKFADRCGHFNSNASEYEKSPVFLQWLDCVFQLQHQYPFRFEFNEQYLIRLAIHTYSCLFGTFFFNRDCDRRLYLLDENTFSVWTALKETKEFYNEFYCENKEVLRPSCQIRNFKFWNDVYLQIDFVQRDTFTMLTSKKESAPEDASAPSVSPKRKTSSPKEDLDSTKIENPLDTSNIPEIKVEDADAVYTDEEEQYSSLFAPLDLMSSILPNMYSMYEGLCNMVPSFPFYGSTEAPEKSESPHSKVWLFDMKKSPEEEPKVLDFDGLFIQEDDFASVVAAKFREKNKEASCEPALPKSDA